MKLGLVRSSILFSILFAIYLVFDVLYAVSAYWRVVLLFTAVSSGFGWFALHAVALRRRVLAVAIGCAAAVGVRYLDWDSRKPFLRHLFSLRVGMTRAEVESVMGRYLHAPELTADPLHGPTGTGSEAQPGDAIVYRHTNTGAGESDWGVVRFAAGRVVAVDFAPD